VEKRGKGGGGGGWGSPPNMHAAGNQRGGRLSLQGVGGNQRISTSQTRGGYKKRGGSLGKKQKKRTGERGLRSRVPGALGGGGSQLPDNSSP